jgi:hypothetical protein
VHASNNYYIELLHCRILQNQNLIVQNLDASQEIVKSNPNLSAALIDLVCMPSQSLALCVFLQIHEKGASEKIVVLLSAIEDDWLWTRTRCRSRRSPRSSLAMVDVAFLTTSPTVLSRCSEAMYSSVVVQPPTWCDRRVVRVRGRREDGAAIYCVFPKGHGVSHQHILPSLEGLHRTYLYATHTCQRSWTGILFWWCAFSPDESTQVQKRAPESAFQFSRQHI